jgi:hypothetical protein
LFAILWLLGTGFVLALLPMVRDVRAGRSLARSLIGLGLRAALLIAMAWL